MKSHSWKRLHNQSRIKHAGPLGKSDPTLTDAA